MEAVAVACVQIVSAEVFFRRWLCRHEAGRGGVYFRTSAAYREYHAACLQRCLLRQFLRTEFASVIAGSFLASVFLESIGTCSWTPNDIDVFFFDVAALKFFVGLYKDIVVETLGYSLDLQGSLQSCCATRAGAVPCRGRAQYVMAPLRPGALS